MRPKTRLPTQGFPRSCWINTVRLASFWLPTLFVATYPHLFSETPNLFRLENGDLV